MSEVYASFLIPHDRLIDMEKAVKKLARRIESGKTKADFAPTIEATREQVVVFDGRMSMFDASNEYSDNARFVPYVWVTLHYQQPMVEGWHLIAVYDWEVTEDGTRTCYTSTVPGQMILKQHREVEDGRCDHCHTNRRRKKSMLITKDFIDYKVVGTTCIKDFLGHASAQDFVDLHTFHKMVHECSNQTTGVDSEAALYETKNVLMVAAMVVRKFGYVKTNDYDAMPTVHHVHSYIAPNDKFARQFVVDNPITSDDIKMADETAEYIMEQDASSDYIENLHKAITAGAISPKRFGVVSSAIAVYKRHIEREMDEKHAYLAPVGERLKALTGTVERVCYKDGMYGTTTIVSIREDRGHSAVWFASGYKEIEQGSHWTFDGTVKGHNEFKGTKQTVLSRVKYNEV